MLLLLFLLFQLFIYVFVCQTGSLTLEWEGLQARIVRPDVQAVNGVMHVIDRVMMKRRDLTKSDSSNGPRCGGFVLFLLFFAWVAVLF